MKIFTLLFCLFLSGYAFAQKLEKEVDSTDEQAIKQYHDGGFLNLGVRSTMSLFSGDGNMGMGTGGQFRVGLTPWLNTEWFLDYINSSLYGYGKRTDAHIGWSVLFYPLKFERLPFIQPYIIAGHCFDYSKLRSNNYTFQNFDDQTSERWSSAIQGGLGVHFHAGERVDFSVNTQYMWHFGDGIGVEFDENAPVAENPLHIHEGGDSDILEGHLLITFSMNVKIADLW